MKSIVGYVMLVWAAVVMASMPLAAQSKVDSERMDRDIEVAENALATMIRQQFTKTRYYGMEIRGNYTPGYGVTLRLPGDYGYMGTMSWDSKGGAVIAAPSPPGVPGGSRDITIIRPGAEVVGRAGLLHAGTQSAKSRRPRRPGTRRPLPKHC